MKAPEFWSKTDSSISRILLLPFSWLYGVAGWLRQKRVCPRAVGLPVICIGNLVAGGSGKTPVALFLADYLRKKGYQPHFLSRGYGGVNRGPLQVDLNRHDASEVGDEPLLLARSGPAWVARDRVAGACAAGERGAGLIVMDDGFQNPHLKKDFSILVIDTDFYFGNGALFPAGPLRESVAAGMTRAHAVILIGDGAPPAEVGNRPYFAARLEPARVTVDLKKGLKLAFAGIGRPEKFFKSLRKAGYSLVAEKSYADHHNYSRAEIEKLKKEAARAGAGLITTEKDFIRLPPALREDIETFPVKLAMKNEDDFFKLIERVLADG